MLKTGAAVAAKLFGGVVLSVGLVTLYANTSPARMDWIFGDKKTREKNLAKLVGFESALLFPLVVTDDKQLRVGVYETKRSDNEVVYSFPGGKPEVADVLAAFWTPLDLFLNPSVCIATHTLKREAREEAGIYLDYNKTLFFEMAGKGAITGQPIATFRYVGRKHDFEAQVGRSQNGEPVMQPDLELKNFTVLDKPISEAAKLNEEKEELKFEVNGQVRKARKFNFYVLNAHRYRLQTFEKL